MINNDQIQEAVKLLKATPDGSKANAQARARARHTMALAAAWLRNFAALKPGTAPALSMEAKARDYQAMTDEAL